MWIQKQITLKPLPRGFHLITNEIISHLPELDTIVVGVINLFIQHTSASLLINENVSSDVRSDMEKYFNKIIPDNNTYFDHTLEGSDDMPAHIKSSMIGQSLTLPIKNGRICFGTWQGIYLGEHRNFGGARNILVTINGDG